MKKIISLLLCLVMLAATLVSCGGGNSNTKPEADRPNKTLRMAIVVDDKTTKEGVRAMQDAFNAACEVNLATRIEFVCIKASEYREKMDEILSGVASAGKNQSAAIKDAATNADGGTVVEDEYAFPAASAGQFDILLIADREMYEDYINKGWIKGLNAHLGGTFKVLNTKILPTVKATTLYGEKNECYGIPANKAYGEYTYLVLNKEAVDYYNIDYRNITSLAGAQDLIAAMDSATGVRDGVAKWQQKYGEDFSVIRESEEDYVMPNVQYLSKDLSSFSLIGATYGFATSIARVENAKNLLKNDEYVRYLATKFVANQKGYFGDGTAENFLVGIEKGDYALRFSNEDYYYCPIMYPIVEKDDAFGGMLAVSSFTVDEKRSLEIIQELMTNATGTGLLNIALYGDMKNNYTLETVDDISCVAFRNMSNYAVHKDYMFGGLREHAYPCLDYGQNAHTYEFVSSQVADLGTRTPLFDEYFYAYFEVEVNADNWAAVDAISQAKYDELMASADIDAFLAKVDALVDELDADEVFSTLEQADAGNDNWSFSTLGGSFYKYLRDRVDGKLGKPGSSSDSDSTTEEGTTPAE